MPPLKDLKGQGFGRLTVVELLPERKNGKTVWRCLCECGGTKDVSSNALKTGGTKSCGCLLKEQGIKIGRNKLKDLTGNRFGCLTVIELLPERKGKKAVWHCLCDCGDKVDVWSSDLITGNTASCGCLRKKSLAETRLVYEEGRIDGVVVNALTSKISIRNKSGVKGVSFDGTQQKWVAVLQVGGEIKLSAKFSNKEDAIAARKAAEEMYHKPYIEKYERMIQNREYPQEEL